jgi:hypothetical protein
MVSFTESQSTSCHNFTPVCSVAPRERIIVDLPSVRMRTSMRLLKLFSNKQAHFISAKGRRLAPTAEDEKRHYGSTPSESLLDSLTL